MAQRWTDYLPRSIRERLSTSPLLRKLVGNTGWLFADRVLRLGVGLVVGIWVSRYLGPEQFGLYSYLIAIVALLTPLASFGLDNIVVRELVASPAAARRILGTAFVLKLSGGGAVLALAVLVISILHPGQPVEGLLIAVIAAGTMVQAFDVTDLWFQSQTSARYTVYAKSTAFLAVSLLRVILILTAAPLSAFVWVALLEIALGSLGSVYFYWRHALPLTAWRPAQAEARRLLATSWPLLFSGLAIMIFMKIDIIMLTQLRGEAATGLYAAALRLSEVWYFIPMTITASVTPAILASRRADGGVYYRRLEQLFVLMTRLSLAFAIPISLLSYPLMTFLFGSEYRDAAPVLAIHVWSAVFVFMGVAQSPWDLGEDLTRLALYRTMGGAVINIGINFALIPPLGAIGAAIATAVAYACSAWLLNLIDPRSRPIFLLQTRALNPFSGLWSPQVRPVPSTEEERP